MGLVRALKFLADNSLQVATLVTDRHNQIAKYMTEVKPEIEHRYDVWHVSKGTSPKLMTAYCLLALIMTGIKKKSARLAKTRLVNGLRVSPIIYIGALQLLLMVMTLSSDGNLLWIIFVISKMIVIIPL